MNPNICHSELISGSIKRDTELLLKLAQHNTAESLLKALG